MTERTDGDGLYTVECLFKCPFQVLVVDLQSFAQKFVWPFEFHFLRIEMRFSGVRPVTRCSEAIELEISALEQDPIILPPAILFTTQDFDINLKF